ncbi:hypothetical protein, partial [Nocardia gipuzkoensis]|uniref:hypothetical protein n=1 Tax=Nocardia gipuzkoensis TaxID=2749991 RepID=UPI0024589479
MTGEIVYEADIRVTMRGVDDPVGLPYTVNPVELYDREALVELREGPPGGRGPRGAGGGGGGLAGGPRPFRAQE